MVLHERDPSFLLDEFKSLTVLSHEKLHLHFCDYCIKIMFSNYLSLVVDYCQYRLILFMQSFMQINAFIEDKLILDD